MPNIIVEDGSLPAGANSFVSVAVVAAWATLRGRVWNPVGTPQAEAAVLEAAEYLRNEMRYVYRGTKKTLTQLLPFPRVGATEYRGQVLPDTYISWRLQDAQSMLSVRALAKPGQLQADLARGGMVKSEKVDVLSTDYADNAPIETLLMEVQGLLQPLLLVQGNVLALPYLASPTDPFALTPGQFDDPTPNTTTQGTSA